MKHQGPRATLERKYRMKMSDILQIGPLDEVQHRIVKGAEEMAGDTLSLCSVYFWMGVGTVVIGQIIYRVVF